MEIDILGKSPTFHYNEKFALGTKEYERANYTIEVLGLNRKDYLVQARKVAFGNYKARLSEYVMDKENGTTQAILDELVDDLKKESHPTVWKEMIRQRQYIPQLRSLFNRVPEALLF